MVRALVARRRTREPIAYILGRRDFHGATFSVDARVLDEALIIAAGLSIQDPRERPADAKQAADLAHAQFADPKSDFVAVLKLWEAYSTAHEDLTQSKLRDWCEKHFLSFLRMREWRELHAQLSQIADELKLRRNELPATYEPLHKALLTGLLGNVGMKSLEGDDYLGARGIHFHIFPASGLKKARPKWLVSAELTETSKLYARCVASIQPEFR